MSEAQIAIRYKPAANQLQVVGRASFAAADAATQTRAEVGALIEKIGVIPVVCLETAADALFVAEALAEAGVPIVEISAKGRGALEAISILARKSPEIIVGAGSLFNTDMASRCLVAGAQFLTSDIFVRGILELAAEEETVVIPGALTPAEIMTAWNAGADFVKVTPCDAMGGHNYIRSLKAALPDVRLVAAGGVNQLTALSFIEAEAAALSVCDELTRPILLRQPNRIQELARRFRKAVDTGRAPKVTDLSN
jgi:2-dehydro-3-deoxyphosphogluconate aldolase/(4S)-4-hydroxy-2-oxoglutarate aldolase